LAAILTCIISAELLLLAQLEATARDRHRGGNTSMVRVVVETRSADESIVLRDDSCNKSTDNLYKKAEI
jgi:hypothetical protein